MGGFNGAGVYQRFRDWTDDRDAGIKIRADYTDIEMDGVATGLSNAICRDGQSTVTANISMSSHKFTNLLAGTSAGDSVRYEQVMLVGALAAGQTLTSTSIGTVLTLQSTETGASGGPDLVLWRNSSTPGLNDVGGSILFDFEDSGGTQTSFARIRPVMVDMTDTDERGALLFGLTTDGTMVDEWTMVTGALYPSTNGAATLGVATHGIADLFLANDAVITFGPTLSEVTISHSSSLDKLSFGGATGGISFANPVTMASTLGVTGAVTMASTLGVTGNATVGGTLGVTGNATMGGTLTVTGNVLPSVTNTLTLGSASLRWAGLNLSSDSVIDFNGGANLTYTAGILAFGGTTFLVNANLNSSGNVNIDGTLAVGASLTVGTTLTVTGNVLPAVTNTPTLGSSTRRWGDLHLGDGSTINWNGDVVLTHSLNTLTITSGNLAISGAQTISSTLGVTGVATFTAAIAANGGGTLGNATGDVVMIKGVTVTAAVADNWDSSTAAIYTDTLLDALGTETEGGLIWHNGTSWVILAPP